MSSFVLSEKACCCWAYNTRSDLFTYIRKMGAICNFMHKLFKYETDRDFDSAKSVRNLF